MDMNDMLKMMLSSQNKDVPNIDPSNPLASLLPMLLASQKKNKPTVSRHGENSKKADREFNYTLHKLYNDD